MFMRLFVDASVEVPEPEYVDDAKTLEEIKELDQNNNMSKKLILDTNDDFWKKVLKYKIDNNFKNNNEAVLDLLKKGLKNEKSY